MSQVFKREERYFVIKQKYLDGDQYQAIMEIAGHAFVKAAVVETDWPEYEHVWKMIERRVSQSGSDPMSYAENDPLPNRLTGRAAFCRDRGEVKTPELLEEAAGAIAAAFRAGWDACDSLHVPGKHPFHANVDDAWLSYVPQPGELCCIECGGPLETPTGGSCLNHKCPLGMELVAKAPTLDTAPHDLAHCPEVPHHRFSVFHEHGDYAYARGLEVNPTHLPIALDAMRLSGWNLLAIFGQTDSQHIGFVFRRQEPAFDPMDILERAAELLAVDRDRARARVDDLLRANNDLVDQRRASDAVCVKLSKELDKLSTELAELRFGRDVDGQT